MSYFDRPILVMFTSIPGSGKSYFARQAAERMGAVRLSSDAFRPAMFGSVEAWREAEEKFGRRPMLNQLFGAMDYASEQVLLAGNDLMYDTNTNKREYRRVQDQRAHKSGAVAIVIQLEVPYEVALQRGQDREEQADQRRKDEAGMRELIDRIQSETDSFDADERVISLDGQKPFVEQFAEFEKQVKELLRRG
jgi:predicted kinase